MATYREIKEFVRQRNEFVPRTRWIAHVMTDYGLTSRSIAYRKNPSERAKPCPADKRPAIVAALLHFRMVRAPHKDFVIVGTTGNSQAKVYWVGLKEQETSDRIEDADLGDSQDAYDISDQLNDEAKEAGADIVWQAEPDPRIVPNGLVR